MDEYSGNSAAPRHIRFDAAGMVALHCDSWDAAEELYEKLPVLEGLMRWLNSAASR